MLSSSLFAHASRRKVARDERAAPQVPSKCRGQPAYDRHECFSIGCASIGSDSSIVLNCVGRTIRHHERFNECKAHISDLGQSDAGENV